MAAPDFYFAIHATFRHLHETYGEAALHRYWREFALRFERPRWERWRALGADEIARDWRDYFANEPGGDVAVTRDEAGGVTLDVRRCPAIAHLRASGRPIVPYFCDHCDHTCGAMAEAAGFAFSREGGMGTCRQRFVPLTRDGAKTGTAFAGTTRPTESPCGRELARASAERGQASGHTCARPTAHSDQDARTATRDAAPSEVA